MPPTSSAPPMRAAIAVQLRGSAGVADRGAGGLAFSEATTIVPVSTGSRRR